MENEQYAVITAFDVIPKNDSVTLHCYYKGLKEGKTTIRLIHKGKEREAHDFPVTVFKKKTDSFTKITKADVYNAEVGATAEISYRVSPDDVSEEDIKLVVSDPSVIKTSDKRPVESDGKKYYQFTIKAKIPVTPLLSLFHPTERLNQMRWSLKYITLITVTMCM